MSHKSSITLVVTVGFLLLATAMVGAVNAAPAQPVATIVSVEGATTTYHSQDQDGQTVTVQVPSHSSADIKGRDAQGIVRATVTGRYDHKSCEGPYVRGPNDCAGNVSCIPHEHAGGRSIHVHASRASAIVVERVAVELTCG